ncbi:MAG: hypothetical protein OXN18_13240 [Gemmatimonadota bacterium]|nr:hypothetical protein [Gemmatimonadota bacterium]
MAGDAVGLSSDDPGGGAGLSGAGGPTPRALWLAWILASGVGGWICAIFARPVSIAVGGVVGNVLGPIAAEAAVGALAMGGVLLGVAVGQWLVIRRHVSWAGWSALATALAGAAGGAGALGALQAVAGVAGEAGSVAVAVVLGLAAFWLVHWWVLKTQICAPGHFATLGVVALIAAVLGTALVGAIAGDLAGQGIGGGTLGAVYAAVTGRRAINEAQL